MCWKSIKSLKCVTPHVADEDFEVMKVLKKNGKTPFQEYDIKFNQKLPTVKIKPKRNNNPYNDYCTEIDCGYHSYAKDCIVKEDNEYISICHSPAIHQYHKEHDIHEAYIPKGTEYYLNEYGDIVSETLVVKDKIIPTNTVLDILVVVDENGTLKRKEFDETLDKNIVGVILDDNPWYNGSPRILSLLDEDWTPKGIDMLDKSKTEFARRYGSAERKIITNGIYYESTLYRLKEILTGYVDWDMPYWEPDLNGKRYFGKKKNTEGKAYLIPITTSLCE